MAGIPQLSKHGARGFLCYPMEVLKCLQKENRKKEKKMLCIPVWQKSFYKLYLPTRSWELSWSLVSQGKTPQEPWLWSFLFWFVLLCPRGSHHNHFRFGLYWSNSCLPLERPTETLMKASSCWYKAKWKKVPVEEGHLLGSDKTPSTYKILKSFRFDYKKLQKLVLITESCCHEGMGLLHFHSCSRTASMEKPLLMLLVE